MAAKSQGPVQVRFTAPVAGLTHNVAEIKRGDLVYVRKRPNGSNFGTPWAYTMDISAVEYVTTGFRSYGPYVTGPAVNSLRSIGDVIGGITAMRKSAALCEAFNINYDPHSYGTTHVQVAHLHIMLAIHHCDYAELPVPQGIFDHGMRDAIRIDSEGYIHAPTKPGLGYEADKDVIDEMTIRHP